MLKRLCPKSQRNYLPVVKSYFFSGNTFFPLPIFFLVYSLSCISFSSSAKWIVYIYARGRRQSCRVKETLPGSLEILDEFIFVKRNLPTCYTTNVDVSILVTWGKTGTVGLLRVGYLRSTLERRGVQVRERETRRTVSTRPVISFSLFKSHYWENKKWKRNKDRPTVKRVGRRPMYSVIFFKYFSFYQKLFYGISWYDDEIQIS